MDPHPKDDKSIQTLEMPTDPVIIHELSEIEKIVRDEMWLEGERRGGYVPPDDPVVRENVCRVILRIGAELRKNFLDRMREPAPTLFCHD